MHGFMKVLMMSGDAQVVDCPLSMTDGCARGILLLDIPFTWADGRTSHIVLELHAKPALREVFQNLIR